MPQPQGPGEGGSLEVRRVGWEAAQRRQEWRHLLLTIALGGLVTRGLRLRLTLSGGSAVGSSVSAGVSRGVLVLGEGGWETEQSRPKIG